MEQPNYVAHYTTEKNNVELLFTRLLLSVIMTYAVSENFLHAHAGKFSYSLLS